MPRRDQIEKMLEREPRDVFLHFALAMELVKAGETSAALQRFDRVLELDGAYVPAYYQKGRLQIAMGHIDVAAATIRSGMRAAQAAGDTHASGELEALLQETTL